MSSECAQRDLVSSRKGLLVWGIPVLLILAGGVLPALRILLWPVGFFVAGAACITNARRCGRTHCYITGPLYVGLSAASALIGLGLLSWNWSSVLVLWGGGTLVAFLPEFLGKRYLRGSP